MSDGQQQTFTSVQPIQQSFSNVVPIDSGGSVSSSFPDTDAYWNRLKDKYGLPHSIDLSKSYLENAQSDAVSNEDWKKVDAVKFGQAVAEANPGKPRTTFLEGMKDEAKNILKGMSGEGALFGNPQESGSVGGTQPFQNPIPGVQSRIQEAKERPSAAAGAATTDVAVAAIPFLFEGASKIWGKVNPSATIEAALGRSLSTAEAETPHPSGEMIPALNNTPREVLEYAKKNGINLTPGQATGDPLAQNLEKSGRSAAIGGKELDAAVNQSRTQFGQVVRKFVEAEDPKRLGLSAEQSGESIQQSAKTAKTVAHDNASQGYEKISYLMDSPVEGSIISNAWNKIKGDLPIGAEDAILSQTPRSMRAVVEDLLSGKPEGFKPTVQDTIQLRKLFRDLGDTEGLPDKTQATYQKMEGAASSALDATAKANNASAEWDAANAGWKTYVSKYGDRKSTLYKILNQNDPTKVVTALQNAPATDIELLRNENMTAALEPLKRQVIQDIAQNRFNIGRDGLGGYSDSYLKALFGPAKTKELYVQANLAKRLNYDPNPSGTAAGIQSLEQLTLGNQTKMAAAARLSMPRDPLSYLPPRATASPSSRTAMPQPITLKPVQPFGQAVNQ